MPTNPTKSEVTTIIKTMQDYCDAQIIRLRKIKDAVSLEPDQRGRVTELQGCIDLYEKAKKEAPEKTKAELSSKFVSFFDIDEQGVDVVNKGKNNVDDVMKVTHNLTSDIARAERATIKILNQDWTGASQATVALINQEKQQFQVESRHFWKKVSLLVVGAVYITAAVTIGLASHGLLGPLAFKIAALGIKSVAAAITKAPLGPILGHTAIGAVALGTAAAYQFKGESKISLERMKTISAEVRNKETKTEVSPPSPVRRG